MINKAFVMGPVKTIPMLKTTDNGTLFGHFTVEARDNTEKSAQWLRVQGFGKVAENMRGVEKDDIVMIEGKIENRKIQDPKTNESKYYYYISANKVVKFAKNGTQTSCVSSNSEHVDGEDLPF